MLKYFVKGQVALANLKKDIEGASLAEYAILLGLIAAAVIGIALTIGGQILGIFTGFSNTLAQAPGGAVAP